MSRKSKTRSTLIVALGSLLVFGLTIWVSVFSLRWLVAKPTFLGLPRVTLQQVDLFPSIRMAGDVDTAKKTTVECKLENRSNRSAMLGGSSTIIELVPDGSLVEAGQMLARLDSSDFEELVRQYEILYSQAQAEYQKAQYDLEVAQIALKEYGEGLLDQLRENYRSQIVLHESNIKRQKDRIDWAEKMYMNQYISESQVLQEHSILQRSEVALASVEGAFNTLNVHSAPLELRRLNSEIEQASLELDYQLQRLRRREKQLQGYRDQVEACTIKAPHAGRVVYASMFNPALVIEPGASVYNKMVLFYLPDLSQLEVQVEVHESMIRRVREGLPVKIRIDGFADRIFDGHVKQVEPLPKESKKWWISREVRNFIARVSIDNAPTEIMPGMTAEVEIQEDSRPGVPVLPARSVLSENGRNFVYVVEDEILKKQVVIVGPGDSEVVEILSGLTSGEDIIQDASRVSLEDAQKSINEDRSVHLVDEI